MGGGHLAGVRVLDFGIWRPAPYATQLLAELGADVIKVEPPGGDPMRSFPRLFATLAAHKRSVVADLRSPGDLARVLDLAADADVVVEGFRPGVADLAGGLMAAFAICAALIGARARGEGQRIEVALADVVASWVGPPPGELVGEQVRGLGGYGTFRAADGRWLALGVIAEDHRPALAPEAPPAPGQHQQEGWLQG